MKRGLAFTLTILGLVLTIIAIFGLFGKLNIGSYKWILLILGIIFFPSGISLLKTVKQQ